MLSFVQRFMGIKKVTKVKDHMKSLGLSYRKFTDRSRYASMLASGQVHEPMALRGYKLVAGQRLSRKMLFIAKHA